MPKQRITKDMVVDAAFALARKGGMEQVMVKQIADKLGCSVQPIYSYCKNMEGLRADVTARVCEFVQMYVMERLDEDDLFRSTGNAYVRLAKEEPQLFRIFILHRREGVSSLNELYESETNPEVAGFLADQMHITVQQAQALRRGDMDAFLRLITASGRSSWELCQNCYSHKHPESQGISIALEVTRDVLRGEGAWRVHGGGFAGTIQAFVPDSLRQTYVQKMTQVFGEGAVFQSRIRREGAMEVLF